MSTKLVIVESPAKARTLNRILGRSYTVKASLGHVRDLPKASLGVDIDKGFVPKYVIPAEKKKVVAEIKKAARKANTIYLATDPDREGEAISWHLMEATKLDRDGVLVRRVVFQEITKEAVQEAFRNPRSIDMNLVNAQQARRILDRLVGYKLSPLLWRKVQRGLSAGRVQSVAVRMIVDREEEIENFIPREYWVIEVELAPFERKEASFRARLFALADGAKLDIGSKNEAERVIADLEKADYVVRAVVTRRVAHQPAPPFTTSTLQQEAWQKLRFTAGRTMAIAQQLYEGLPLGKEGSVGLITYMRTDSTHVAPSAISEAREYISDKYGAEFLPAKPRMFTRKAKWTQEAHEAIRPTKICREPGQLKPFLKPAQLKLYELIWKRMVGSQMAAALYDTTNVDIEARNADQELFSNSSYHSELRQVEAKNRARHKLSEESTPFAIGQGDKINTHVGHGLTFANGKQTRGYLLKASSSVLKFPGFMVVYGADQLERDKDERDESSDFTGVSLPKLKTGDRLIYLGMFPEQRLTQPPPRYSEATLIKALEQKGIGRPSTYAPILSTIQERDYVNKVDGRFRPTELGIIVNRILTAHFPEIVDPSFTAQMEGQLDEIARGRYEWVAALRQFYASFQNMLSKAWVDLERVSVMRVSQETCPSCGRSMTIKVGRFGKFLACSGYPDCKVSMPYMVKTGVSCPECGGELVRRVSRMKKEFYGCSKFPQCQFLVKGSPVARPCPSCGKLLVQRTKDWAKCVACGQGVKLPDHQEPTRVAS